MMVLASDHVSPAIGLSPTVTISKNGGSFASPSGSVTEIANGWYQLAGNATDRNTLGELLLHATGTGADPVDDRYDIVAHDPFALPTEVADGVLVRDWTAISASVPSRCLLNAARKVRNKVYNVSGTTFRVCTEDDSTKAWDFVVTTDGAAQPITGVDPE